MTSTANQSSTTPSSTATKVADISLLLQESAERRPDSLIVIGLFPLALTNSSLRNYYINNIPLSCDSNTVEFYYQDTDDVTEPTFQLYKDGEEVQFKNYTLQEIEESESGVNQDLQLFMYANFLAHKLPQDVEEFEVVDEEDEDEEYVDDEEEEEEAEGEEETGEPKKKRQRTSKEGEEEDTIAEEGEEEEEDDEEFDESADLAAAQEEMTDEKIQALKQSLRAGLITSAEDAISQEELMQVWKTVGENLGGNTLLYTTFRNSMAEFVRSVAFGRNPVMKMLANISDPPAPDHEDMVQLITEAMENKEFAETNPKPKHMEEATAVHKCKHELKNKLKASEWNDDLEYSLEAVMSYPEELSEKVEWKYMGGDLLRMQIGSFSISRQYKAQFRFKVDSLNKTLRYLMFLWTPTPPPRELLNIIHQREPCEQYMMGQLASFKNSRVLQIAIPLQDIRSFHYHLSVQDPGLSLLAYDLSREPVFYEKPVITNTDWTKRFDFTNDKQASKISRHFVIGYDEEFSKLVSLMYECDESFRHAYQHKPKELSAVSKEYPGSSNEQLLQSNEASDEPFKSWKEDTSQQQGAASSGASSGHNAINDVGGCIIC